MGGCVCYVLAPEVSQVECNCAPRGEGGPPKPADFGLFFVGFGHQLVPAQLLAGDASLNA